MAQRFYIAQGYGPVEEYSSMAMAESLIETLADHSNRNIRAFDECRLSECSDWCERLGWVGCGTSACGRAVQLCIPPSTEASGRRSNGQAD